MHCSLHLGVSVNQRQGPAWLCACLQILAAFGLNLHHKQYDMWKVRRVITTIAYCRLPFHPWLIWLPEPAADRHRHNSVQSAHCKLQSNLFHESFCCELSWLLISSATFSLFFAVRPTHLSFLFFLGCAVQSWFYGFFCFHGSVHS
jgi:hypothetical protein